MKEILEKLKEQGWYLTEEGLRKILLTQNPNSTSTETAADLKKIIETAKNLDFREIASGALPKELSRKEETIPGKIVLQVQKIRNISAPKANEESTVAPRLLQVDLADGSLVIQALEFQPIPILSLNTPPGTKIFFKSDLIKLMQGIIVLQDSEVQLIGGNVTALVEKWEMARKFQKYARMGRRISGISGPPPWIPFGKKIEAKDNLTNERNFKSLSQANKNVEKDKDSKDNTEFNAMRSEAIAEAAKCGARKVFGGGNQQIIDHNMKKILEKGYSEEEAKHALRTTGNNLERALYNLKRRDEHKVRDDDKEKNPKFGAGKHGRGAGRDSGRRGETRNANNADKNDASLAAKPVSNVSLFDFLTDKFPTSSEKTATTPTVSASQSAISLSNSQQSTSKSVNKTNDNKSNMKFDKTLTKPNTELTKSSSHSGRPKSNKNQERESRSHSKTQAQNEKTIEKSSSQPKFENNLSSSFAANNNRTTPNPFRVNREHNGYERAPNRQSGRGKRGGRGGSYDRNYNNNIRNGNGENNRRDGFNHNINNNSNNITSVAGNNNNNINKNNRSSHDRTAVGSVGGGCNNIKNAPQTIASSVDNNHRNDRNQNQMIGNGKHRSEKISSNNIERKNSRYTPKEHFKTANHAGGGSEPHPSSNKIEDQTASLNKLVESTSKLKIDKQRSGQSYRNNQQQSAIKHQQQQQQQQSQANQQYSIAQLAPVSLAQQQQQQPSSLPLHFPNHSQQPPQAAIIQAQQPPANNVAQLPNGFAYDPSKIIGFQNKETNDFALTLLKSQGIPLASNHPNATNAIPFTGPNLLMQNQPNHPTQLSPITSMQPIQQIQTMNPQPFATAPFSIVPEPPPQMSLPIQLVQHDNWQWKIGDHCLAKYWDDGRYYDAKITGISDKTCVVLYLGYGNHEEVLKSDCLPITETQHHPIDYGNIQSTNPIQILSSASSASGFARGVPNRYRGERQVYVPPPKREN